MCDILSLFGTDGADEVLALAEHPSSSLRVVARQSAQALGCVHPELDISRLGLSDGVFHPRATLLTAKSMIRRARDTFGTGQFAAEVEAVAFYLMDDADRESVLGDPSVVIDLRRQTKEAMA